MIRVIDDGEHDGPENMARDLALLEDLKEFNVSARVYTWTTPYVTLGRFQNHAKALLPDCPIPYVSRPTGGKAVLHGHDITLGLAASLDHLNLTERKLKPAYRAVIRPLIAALNAVGVPAILGEDLQKFPSPLPVSTTHTCHPERSNPHPTHSPVIPSYRIVIPSEAEGSLPPPHPKQSPPSRRLCHPERSRGISPTTPTPPKPRPAPDFVIPSIALSSRTKPRDLSHHPTPSNPHPTHSPVTLPNQTPLSPRLCHPESPSPQVRGAKELRTQAPVEVKQKAFISFPDLVQQPPRKHSPHNSSPSRPEIRPKTEDCFAYISDIDIVNPHTGQKICGCALRIYPHAVLLQASIPISSPLIDPHQVFANPSTLHPLPPFNPAEFAAILSSILS